MNAKGSTAVTTIPKAQKTGRLNVVTEAHVTEVNVDAKGRVTGVTYVKGTEVFYQPASVVLLATYTYENVRTLLLSKSKAYPQGPVEQPRAGRPALHDARDRRQRDGAVSDGSEQLVWPSGAGRRR